MKTTVCATNISPKKNNSANSSMSKYEIEIRKFLLSLNINPANKGYKYITYALLLINSNFDYYSGAVVKHLYTDIAEKWNVSPSNVERAIRHEVSRLPMGNPEEPIARIFGQTRHISVSRFLFCIYEYFQCYHAYH